MLALLKGPALGMAARWAIGLLGAVILTGAAYTTYTAITASRQVTVLEASLEAHQEALRVSEAVRQADRTALFTREVRLRELSIQKEALENALNEALEEHPDFSRTPVPESVRSSLLQ